MAEIALAEVKGTSSRIGDRDDCEGQDHNLNSKQRP